VTAPNKLSFRSFGPYRGLMSATMTERTVLPGEPTQRMADLLTVLKAHGRPALVAADGTHIELPDELYEVLKDVVAALSQGLAITVAPQHTVLTTSQAADLLGVSRPTLVRLLEAGEIPFDKPGRHRRLRLGDVLAYQERARRARAAGLDEMVRASEDAGIYDLPHDALFERAIGHPEVDSH
jgi:excisionase family DNA binding protein